MPEKDEEFKIKLSAKDDIDHLDMEDYVPHELLKVYPYLAVFGSKDKAFQETNTLTLVRVSQFLQNQQQTNQLDSIDIFNNLNIDELGNKYMKMYGVHTEQTGAHQLQADGKETIRKIKSFTALVNNYVETNDDKPIFVSIGEPFNLDKFKTGEQKIYFVESTTPANKDIKLDLQDQSWAIDDDDAIAEMQLLDISELEKQYDGSKIVFTTDINLGKNALIQDGSRTGITLDIQNSTLIHSVKAKGIISEDDGTPFFGNIDFHSKEPLTPFRASLIGEEDKVEIQADWLNSQLIMPEFIAEQFKDGLSLKKAKADMVGNNWEEETVSYTVIKGPDGLDYGKFSLNKITAGERIGSLQMQWNMGGVPQYIAPYKNSILTDYNFQDGTMTVLKNIFDFNGDNKFNVRYIHENQLGLVLNSVDLDLIEDMLIISAGYADDWAKAPVYTSGTEVGHIKTDFRVGHGGIKVSTIQKSNPRDIIDGLLESHIRKYPDFVTNKQRNFLTMSTIASLSRYIYSSHSIADGGNNFNELYLPWFLELSPVKSTSGNTDIVIPIDYSSHSQKIPNPDAGISGTVDSFVLPGTKYNTSTFKKEENSDVNFKIKTHYFKENFTNEMKLSPTNILKLPLEPNLSDVILTETDRKMLLPQLGEMIKNPSKINFPKDIKDEKDLQYLFWLTTENYKKIYIDSFNTTEITPAGTQLDYQIPSTSVGIVWTQQQAEDEIKKLYKNIEYTNQNDLKPIVTKTFNREDLKIIKWWDWANYPIRKKESITIIYKGQTVYFDNRNWESSNNTPWGWFNLSNAQIEEIIEKKLHMQSGTIEIEENVKEKFRTQEDFKAKFYYSDFSLATFTLTKDLSAGIFSYKQRPFKFDQQSFKRFLKELKILPNEFTEINLLQKEDFKIKELHKLDLYYMWGQTIKLKLNGSVWWEVGLNNKEDEKITKQSIIIW